MTGFLLLATLFLVAALIAVPVATRLGLGSVLGYLVAGMAISPLLAALHVDVTAIQHGAEFGVVMMLFLVGLELEPRTLWAMRGQLLGLGGLQVVLTAAAVMAAGMALGLYWTIALTLGMVLALSSTAIVLQTLEEKGLLRSDGGQASFAVLLFQDIAVIPMLALLPLLAMPALMDPAPASHAAAAHDAGLSLVEGRPGWQVALITLTAIAAVVFIGNRLTRPLFRFVALAHLRELFTATALALVLGIAALMSLVGLSPALGTFIAGVVLASSEYRHELESDIAPFRGLLLGLFFMTVGANIDFGLLAQRPGVVIGLTVALMALKAAVLWGLARGFGIGGSGRWLLTLGLAQAGEFGFVLLSMTVAAQAVPQSLADLALLVVALSMLLTPALFILYDRVIVPRLAVADSPSDPIEPGGPIIIAGHGRFGGIIARMLRSIGEQPVVVDYSSRQLDMLRQFGIEAYFGDATRPDLLHAAGIAKAKLLVVAIDGKDQITALTRHVARNFPRVHIVARAVDRTHVYELYEAGAGDIIRETFDSAVRSGRSALEALGFTHEEAEELAARFVAADKASLRRMAEVWKPGLAPQDNPDLLRFAQAERELLEAGMRQGRSELLARRDATAVRAGVAE